jgi:molecular chaperone GrpE (heat shock protein)
MAKALLTTIDAIETALRYAHFVEKQDYEELAKSLEKIRREWEVQA